MTVADAYNCRILFIRNHRDRAADRPHRGLRPRSAADARRGQRRHAAPRRRRARLRDQRLVDRQLQPDGKLRWSFQAPVWYPSDPQPLSGGRILLADYASPGAVVIVNRHGQRALALRTDLRAGGAQPSVARDHAPEREHRDQRRLQPPGRDRRSDRRGGSSGSTATAGLRAVARTTSTRPTGWTSSRSAPHEKPLWQLVHHP